MTTGECSLCSLWNRVIAPLIQSLELLTIHLWQSWRLIGAEKRPRSIYLYPLHEQIGDPQGIEKVTSSLQFVAMVLIMTDNRQEGIHATALVHCKIFKRLVVGIPHWLGAWGLLKGLPYEGQESRRCRRARAPGTSRKNLSVCLLPDRHTGLEIQFIKYLV